MESSSSMLSPSRPNNHSGNQRNVRYYPETGQDHHHQQDNLHRTNELIANLDHELWDVRLRALKCIVSKVDSGIVSPKVLSQRIDLLTRLSDWLRTASEITSTSRKSNSPDGSGSGIGRASAGKGIPIIIQLLIRLAEHEDTRKFILKEKVDCLLAKIRLQFIGETRTLIDRLLYCVNTSSFNFKCEGLPDLWDDNTSGQPVVARYNSPRENSAEVENYHFDMMDRGEGVTLKMLDVSGGKNDKSSPEVIQLDISGTSGSSTGDYYFTKQSVHSVVDKGWAAGVKFGIPAVQLSGTDRRVLASTVESLLSKNESLVYMTACFVRDVLLQDYPPEVFIQESALSMGFLEVAETQWKDFKVQYVAVQGLLKLSNMLRSRVSQLNSSEFYQIKLSSQKALPSFYDGSGSFGTPYKRNGASFTSDMFVGNITQILKSLSRTLLFQPEAFHLWKLMDSFSFTLYKFSSIFPVDSKTLAVGLQEVLLDLAHCYEKNSDRISSSALVLSLSSILHALTINDQTLIVASDVRKCIRNLICCPELFHCWPEVYQYFLQYASPFDETLTPVSEHMELVCKGLEEMLNVLNIREDVDMTVDTFCSLKEAIPYLETSESEESVEIFISRTFVLCTNPIYQNLIPNIEERVNVILQLMSHSNESVRQNIYSRLRGLVKKHFGPERSPSLLNSAEENIAVSIVLNRNFLNEVLHFGTMDAVPEVQHFAEEILLFLIKSKPAIGAELWEQVLSALTLFLPILECQSDLQTVLGKAVVNLCDPAINEHEFGEYELLCSNLRLIFCCNLRVREEASDRVMKILGQTPSGAVTFRYASFSNYTFASMFNVNRNLDLAEEGGVTISDSPAQIGNLLRQLEACRAEDLESNVRKNALVQVSHLMEDSRLHDSFCNEGGVELISDIISKIASEKDYKYPMDMWPPSVRILKLLCLQINKKVRKTLSENYDILIYLVCGIFTLRADDRFRMDTVHLLSLLLFNSLLKFSENGQQCLLPQIILSKYRIPVVAEAYLKSSSHTPSMQVAKLDNKAEISMDNYPVDKIYKTWWVMGKKNIDFANQSISTTASMFDETLQESKFPTNEFHPREIIVKLLYAVQNATGHEAVTEAVNHLWNYLFPLVINTRLGGDLLDYICKDVPWRDAFYRFLCVEPTCTDDEELLLNVVDLLGFLIANLNEGGKSLTTWIVPLCMEKGCAGLRLLSEHSLKSEVPYAGTMLPTLLRSLFDFYAVVINKVVINIEDEFLWDVFSSYCLILHELGQNGFIFSAVLQPVLHGVALLTSKSAIKLQLAKNSKFCLALIFRVTEAIISLQDRGGGVSSESYRNQGALYYASLSMLHLSILLTTDKKPVGPDWIGKCCAVIPCLWESRDVRVRALGFQLCQVITTSSKGAIMCMTIMESPSVVWTSAYSALMDGEEASVVKHKAASVLLNLLSTWKDVESSGQLNKPLQLPNWATVDDFTKLMSHVYWLPSLSEFFRVTETGNIGEGDVSTNIQLVTPKILAVVCKILIAMHSSNIPQFHPNMFAQAVCSSGLCPIMFRLLGSHSITTDLEPLWWLDCCNALSCLVETLICMTQLDRSVCVTLIGDKRSIASLTQLFLLECLPGDIHGEKASEVLSTLWVNVFTLLSTLCADAGNNFEDLERVIWSQRNSIFSRLVDWLKPGSLVKCRKVALAFTHGLLSRLTLKQQDKDSVICGNGNSSNPTMEVSHPVLCREWKHKNSTYGSVMCQSLMEVYEDAISAYEKLSVLNTLTALICLSPSAKVYAIEHDLVGVLIETLRNFALRYYDSADTSHVGKKSVHHCHDETICILSVLSALVYRNTDAKKSALFNCMGDAFHKIFRWWKSYPDRTLLHTFIETLMNFTEEFPAGSQALTVTTNVLGVGPRKVPTPQSFLIEIIVILQNELDAIDKNPNIKTIEYIFELLKNVVFVAECRNVVVKSTILAFLRKLHVREMKKWGVKQHHIKIMYLEFLVHLTVHPDMQSMIAKIPESIEILILLIDLDDPSSSLALKILRNLSFQAANRARFLCDDGLMPALSAKIRDSENLEEIENAAVGLWALIANSEKGKLLAKKSFCHTSVPKAVARLRKLEHSSNDLLTEKRDLSNLINVLTTLGNLLGASGSIATVTSPS